MSTFHFKQFAIVHDKATMKVGTDGVLLGAWAQVDAKNQILDVGTGSGVIALMLAQRTSSRVFVDGVEIEKQDSEQATENAARSPWADRVKIYHSAFQDFTPNKRYDCIVSNPPYFNNSQKPPDSKRVQTRHTTTLQFAELVVHAKRLLTSSGTLNVVLPYVEGIEFIALASRHQFYCTRQWSFRTRQEKPIERWLLEFSFTQHPVNTGEILLYSKGEDWSDSYRALTRDFYLKL